MGDFNWPLTGTRGKQIVGPNIKGKFVDSLRKKLFTTAHKSTN